MQKVVIFGKSQLQNINPDSNHKITCHSCARLNKQITLLNLKLSLQSQELQKIIQNSESQIINKIRKELLEVHLNYNILKKKVNTIEKQNDDLFNENTRLENLLKGNQNTCKEDHNNTNFTYSSENQTIDNKISYKGQHQPNKSTKNIQKTSFDNLKDKNEQIMRLRNLIMNRQKRQNERHQLLQLFL